MSATWELYSMEVAGRVLPMSDRNEEYVAIMMIQKWLDSGLSTAKVILRWNHPAGVVNGCGKGVNAQGVAWNSCLYQKLVLALL